MIARRHRTIGIAAGLALIATLALGTAALAAPTTLTATLAGVTEGASPGDPDGSGTASIVIDPAAGTACWTLNAQGIAAVTQSHIHTGAAGVSGGVLVPLDVDGFTGTSEGCSTAQDAAALQSILDNPAGFYVNLHTADYPAGAIRGQLVAGTPNTAMATPSQAPLVVLGALLLIAAGVSAVRTSRRVSARN